MNNETKQTRKTKEQIIREKKLNASMIPLAKRNQERLGILSVQPEKNVFYLVDKKFVKIYSLKGVELTDTRKKVLIGELCRLSSHRMRISTFYYADSAAPLFFLTVFFSGNSYAEVAEEIDEFDKSLQSLMDHKFKLSFLPCNIGDVFMFIYMNFNGQMKKVSTKSITKRSAHLKRNYFQEIKEQENGYYISKTGKVGKSYICIQYPEEIEISMNVLRRLGVTYLSCIDFQVVEKEYTAYYNKMIEETYGSTVENAEGMLFNLSFMFSYMCANESERDACDNKIKDFFTECSLIVAPCTGTEQKVVESISTFGLIDLHCCRNVSIDVVSKLFG